MSLQAILTRIETDAKTQAAEIIQAAEKECQEAINQVKSTIKEKQQRDIERIKNRTDAIARQMENHARREMERTLLSHRRKIVDEAIKGAVLKIVSASDYLDLIGVLLQGCDLDGSVEVVICSRDRERITAQYLEKRSTDSIKFILAGEFHNDHGGIIMRSGEISLNATLSMIAELNHDSMVMELSRLLPIDERAE
jgi:vacuolar-type H+-ATPase subunit E/Vma4